ncbi:MAG: EFR1 family ferrodoxin [Thermodesulfobacteriota bacterium]|nr:EFR1 family ferrodoxin [Thermodesulfobacteriota bacterium]
MQDSFLQAVIVYSSPAGATRHVAQTISAALREEGWKQQVVDLEAKDRDSNLSALQDGMQEGHCLWIGSPVYVWHSVPAITQFISQLPDTKGSYAVPFVTWGGVSSGVALHELGKMLEEKGYTLLGAAKILAIHSVMMIRSDQPLGKGHPDTRDDDMIRVLVKKVTASLSHGKTIPLPSDELKYQPLDFQEKARNMNLTVAKDMLPRIELNADLCNQCDICAQECPVRTIQLDPLPQSGSDCILCYNCVRLCPENAFEADLSSIENHIRQLKEQLGERPLSQIFI